MFIKRHGTDGANRLNTCGGGVVNRRQLADRGTGRLGPAALLVAIILLPAGCGQPQGELPVPPAPEPSPLPRTAQLSPGDPLPPIPAEGWINGPPLPAGSPGLRLTVLDVWAAWCPYCRQNAPGLIRLHQKYSDRGVTFISITNMDRQSAGAFANEFEVTWPSGYGLTSAGVVALGAGSGMAAPGYEIAPVIYLVGSDDRVRWSDRQGRFRHTAPGDWERELDAAIAAALDGP